MLRALTGHERMKNRISPVGRNDSNKLDYRVCGNDECVSDSPIPVNDTGSSTSRGMTSGFLIPRLTLLDRVPSGKLNRAS